MKRLTRKQEREFIVIGLEQQLQTVQAEEKRLIQLLQSFRVPRAAMAMDPAETGQLRESIRSHAQVMRTKGRKNSSVSHAVRLFLVKNAATQEEIWAHVQSLGLKTTSKKPRSVLNSLLQGWKKTKQATQVKDGKWVLLKRGRSHLDLA